MFLLLLVEVEWFSICSCCYFICIHLWFDVAIDVSKVIIECLWVFKYLISEESNTVIRRSPYFIIFSTNNHIEVIICVSSINVTLCLFNQIHLFIIGFSQSILQQIVYCFFICFSKVFSVEHWHLQMLLVCFLVLVMTFF